MSRLERDRAAAHAASKASQAKAKRENAKHTPGPWVARRLEEEGFCYEHVRDEYGYYIATCHDGVRGKRNADANARLIAESPDLVFQLLSAANYIDSLGGDSKSYRAAIARATGEPQ